MPPELLYKQHKVPTDARPVLGRSLVTNHVLPFNINETTVKKRHDLLQVLTQTYEPRLMTCFQSIPLHHYSQENGLAMSRGERVMKFKNPDTTSKHMLMTEAPSWEALSSVSELTEALMAWQTLDQLIHPSHYGTNVIVWIVKKVYIFACVPTLIYYS